MQQKNAMIFLCANYLKCFGSTLQGLVTVGWGISVKISSSNCSSVSLTPSAADTLTAKLG